MKEGLIGKLIFLPFHSQTPYGRKHTVCLGRPLIYTFLLAYSPRRFLAAVPSSAASSSRVLSGDTAAPVPSAARNFLIEQSEMSGEAGAEHAQVDLDGQADVVQGRICFPLSLSLISAEICISLVKYSAVSEWSVTQATNAKKLDSVSLSRKFTQIFYQKGQVCFSNSSS